LQDYHLEFCEHAGEHGVVIRRFSVHTSDGYDTPCLLCEPSSHPGTAAKGNKVRQELEASGTAVPPWGTIRATLVLLHGHSGRKEDHLPVAERLCAVGFRCILIDLPAHGEHPAPFITFGIHEAKVPHEVLVAAAARYSFSSRPAGLFGISQGGAIALQAAARAEGQWYAVAELSSFAALDDVIAGQARRWFGPLQLPAQAMVRFFVQYRAGYDPRWVRPVDSAALLKTTAALIGHGSADEFVSPRQADLLFSMLSCRRRQFLAVPGAGHHDVLVTPTPVYATLGAFYVNALPTSPESSPQTSRR